MTIRRRRLLVGAFAFAALGMPRGSFGVAWPSAAADLVRPLSDLGVLLAVFVTVYAASTAVSGRLADALGAGRLLVAAGTVAAAGLAVMALGGEWLAVLAGVGLAGAGGGVIDAAVNSQVALHHGPRAMGLLHASFGIGATAGPLVVTLTLQQAGGWRTGFTVFAAVQAAAVLGLLSTMPGWEPPVQAQAGEGRLRRPRVVALSLAVFVLYASVEVGLAHWGYSLLTVGRGVSEAAAGVAVTAYFGALTVSRLALGVAGHRASPSLVMGWGTVAALVGALLVWWAPHPLVAGSGMLLAGAGLGPVFPLGVSLTPSRVGDAATSRMVGYQIAAANLGAAAFPAGVGWLVALAGVGVVGPAVTAAGVVLVVVAEALRRSTRPA